MLKRFDQWDVRHLRGGMIALMLAAFWWLFHHWLVEASLVFALAAAYAVLVYRFAAASERTSQVMLWSCLVNYIALITIEDAVLGFPAAGPWLLGFIGGAIAGGYVWTGPRAGAEYNQVHKRKPEADGSFTGGRRLAVINGVCALALLGIGTAQIVVLSPTMPAAVVLAGAVAVGWALFRFPPTVPARNGLLLVLPVVWFALTFVGGATDQMALPHAWAYGALAGILIGGRYWTGPRLGQPRPPFNGQSKRRRRKRRPKQKETQKRAVSAPTE
ncbi:hypothetical protein [Arthrobacter oryzae]|uniref:hypothetical protein n=1 Tax=Arthrobacter oryzae TaxID=409290 RepID=UPI00273CD35A|nr:hypothetical protein [Arthrobacter oryzae]WLQ06116.1 hypothetical protein Q8Z05_18825 [Arthrobacter oryzae]